MKWALGFGNKEDLWVVMEHTGYYSYQFELFLQDQQIVYTKVSALQIKRSVGLLRGKSDKVDAFTIPHYGWMRREELEAQKVPAVLITELKDLLTLRDKLVRERSGYKARLKEQNATRQYGKTHIQNKIPLKRIKQLTEDIREVEAAMESIIQQSEALQLNYKLLTSIKGVGFITAV